MSQLIPESYADLLEKPAFGNLGTLMNDGSPQVTPIWVDYDGKFVRFNSAKGRVKDKNVRRDPRVSISLQDPANPYRYLEIRGKVVEITENGADDHDVAFLVERVEVRIVIFKCDRCHFFRCYIVVVSVFAAVNAVRVQIILINE